MDRHVNLSMSSRGSRLKRQLRRVVDLAGSGTGLLNLCERRMRRGLTILMYHRILPREQCLGYPLQSLVMPVDAFERQMAWLASRFEVLPVRDAIARLQSGERGTQPMVSITFDDGYADNFQFAAPVMEAQGLRGTFFVTSGFVATGAPLWFDRAAALWARLDAPSKEIVMARMQAGRIGSESARVGQSGPPLLEDWMAALKRLTPERRDTVLQCAAAHAVSPPDLKLAVAMQPAQLAELHRGGHEVAAHSVTHPILPLLHDTELRDEVITSRDQLSAWIDDEVVGFCYPNGDYDDRVVTAASDAGYSYACATTPGINVDTANVLCLHRRSVTMQRTLAPDGQPDVLGFRGEVSGFRDGCR